MPHPFVHESVDVLPTTAVSVFLVLRRQARRSYLRSFVPSQYTTLPEHIPLAVAQRTPDRLRQQAAKFGPVIGVYVDRLLTSREHPEQRIRARLGKLRLADTYGAARVTLACERALAAGALSSCYVEQLLNAHRRQPFSTSSPTKDSAGNSNVRGGSYYN